MEIRIGRPPIAVSVGNVALLSGVEEAPVTGETFGRKDGAWIPFAGGSGGLDAEAVRDTIAAALVEGSGIDITVDDAANTITIAAIGGTGGLDAEAVRDTIAAALVQGSGITITPNDGTDTITISASMDAELVRDTIGAALVEGAGIDITVDDAANTITIAATGAGGLDAEAVRDTIGAALVAGSGVTITPNDGADTITIATDGLNAEAVRDTIGAALVAGSGVTITPNDGADTITISATGTGGIDAETARDTIAAALVAGSGITIAANDGADTITISAATTPAAVKSPLLRTAYIDMIPLGLISDTPDNIRTGLSSTTAAGGGFAAEMAIAVTGTKGSKVLTSTDTAKVAGLGSDPFDAVLNSTDLTQDFPVVVRGNNGSTQITLDKPLKKDFAGTLSPKNEQVNDQHITRAADRAYAQIAADETGYWACRGPMLDGQWQGRPLTADTFRFTKNTALTTYGVSNSAMVGGDGATIVQTALSIADAAATNIAAYNNTTIRPLGGTGITNTGAFFGTHAAGHGAKLTFNLGGRPAALEVFTGASRGPLNLTSIGVRIGVTLTIDEGLSSAAVLYSDEGSDVVMRHRCAVPEGAKTATWEFKNLDGGIYNVWATQATAREPGIGGPIRGQTAIALGDSWFAYHGAAFHLDYAEKTGMTVIDDSLGGTTTEWALDRLESKLIQYRPDVLICDFGINDTASANWAVDKTFLSIDGVTTKRLMPVTTLEEAIARFLFNVQKIEATANRYGTRLIWLMPTGLAGIGQTQTQMQLRWRMDTGVPADSFPATATESQNATAYVNTRGKYKGKRLLVNGAYKTASGSATADPWEDIASDAVAALQSNVLVRSNYEAVRAFTVGVDANSDGYSDGVYEASFGTTTGITMTPSIVGGAQRIVSTYPGTLPSGDRRVRLDYTTFAGRTYLEYIVLKNTTPSNAVGFDIESNLATGGFNSWAPLGGVETVVGSERIYSLREVAVGTSSGHIVGPGPVAGATRQLDIVAAGLIDVASLPANIQTLSDIDIIIFVRGLGATVLDGDDKVGDTGGIAADSAGFRGLPKLAATAARALVLSDASKLVSNTTGGWSIPANATLAFPIGTTIGVYNDSAASQNITITTDTLRLAGGTLTGARTLAARGLATLLKVNATEWIASGAGLT